MCASRCPGRRTVCPPPRAAAGVVGPSVADPVALGRGAVHEDVVGVRLQTQAHPGHTAAAAWLTGLMLIREVHQEGGAR